MEIADYIIFLIANQGGPKTNCEWALYTAAIRKAYQQ